MRLVIDLQGAQGSSRHRGIGRYGMSLAQGLLRHRGKHDVFIALNGAFPDTIQPIRDALHEVIPDENIVVWEGPHHVSAGDPQNAARRQAVELVRESALARLRPDYVLVSSLFEGLGDDIVTSVGELASTVPTAVILFDLIPLIHRAIYLPDPTVEAWYESKLGDIRKADLLLAISESAREESVQYLGLDEDHTVNISTAAEDHFTPGAVDSSDLARLAKELGLTRPFVMYTGGIDHRKNIEGLIEAYARIPAAVRRSHQLAIVCSIQNDVRQRLMKLAADLGLLKDELVLTGFISEADLLTCYRACKLFVFPSWHEGFGLPALEAMQCGRAVIASNRSSLPEVIGLDSALFDPFDLAAMSAKIAEVLSNNRLRATLERHGLEQAKKFSWDVTARRAWAALEESHARRIAVPATRAAPIRRPRLAFISPLPPETSGISTYSVELLPELARHYRIDVITDLSAVSNGWVRGNCAVRDTKWFRANAHAFDRILYHFGNSSFHTEMFDLIRDHPGIVVLHDFYLSGVMSHRDWSGASSNDVPRALLDAHGWPAVIAYLKSDDPAEALWTYPCNLQVLQDALGIIVHSEYSRNLAQSWYGTGVGQDWHLVPHLRTPALPIDREKTRQALEIGADDFLVCSFGMLGPMKLNAKLIAAWLDSPMARDPSCHLVFVGQNDGGDYGSNIKDMIESNPTAGRILITGWTDSATFSQWLNAADVGVQLRTLSRGETSGTVLDCMNVGMATVVNANGSMAELPEDCVRRLDDAFAEADLVSALTALWRDPTARKALGLKAQTHIARQHRPRSCANAYASAIEADYADAALADYGVGRAIAEGDSRLNEAEWADLAAKIARNAPPSPRLKRLFVDVSELVQRDSRSGIQRVVRSILARWLQAPPKGWIIEPVYAESDISGYRHARVFASRFLEMWDGWCEDEVVEPYPGDVFVGLDLMPIIVPQQRATLAGWRDRGVRVQFVVYDLLPLSLPDLFPPAVAGFHHTWLETIAAFDGVICISRAVADEFRDWLDHYGSDRIRGLPIHWFHLGGDTENSKPTTGVPDDADAVLKSLADRPSFLSVGTLEPRKGHRQTLAAFDLLWASGVTANLILVGKQGWMMEDFAAQVRSHQKFGETLFWFEAISDEYLERVYAACTCLIAASEGEGFGLPVIEAMRHGIPVLARDIAVFREVGGDDAAYFDDSLDPTVIASAVRDIIGRPHQPIAMSKARLKTWQQSAEELARIAIGDAAPYALWRPDRILRMSGADPRLITDVGVRSRRRILSANTSGFLMHGPAIQIAAGSYVVTASGTAKRTTGNEYFEIVSDHRARRHMRVHLTPNRDVWSVSQPLLLAEAVYDFEIQLWIDETSEVSFDSLKLEPDTAQS